ncbi:Iojap protein [Pseudohaliea rubra DSM 19751]|uniref:Ribosomal silencing factor RsfS n=1 Tax=Pseudohaliea rubra DSM 19751 TaxID=1265313 RepID=A0A095VM71_9GAMM|nr:Iojap protein [Pseudohaliea rubra DSM 19751]
MRFIDRKLTIVSSEYSGRKQRPAHTVTAEELRDLALAALEDLKGVNVISLDVRDRTDVTDFLVVASGTSNRHVKSLSDSVIEKAKAADLRPLGVEGQDAGEWVLVDLGDVVVHVMLPATRDFYDLERLWAVPDRPG